MPWRTGSIQEAHHIFKSGNRKNIEKTLALFQEKLISDDEPTLISFLVDFYIDSANVQIRNLFIKVKRQQAKDLLSRTDEYMQKASTRLKAISLFGFIVRKEPNWIFEIIPSKTVFHTLLKCLQEDTDLSTITAALYVLVTFMPKVASQLTDHLQTLCKIFFRLVSWNTIKPEGANDVNLMHLNAAVYALFITLYGMFPCHFVKSLKEVYKAYWAQMKKPKGSRNFKDKMRLFENSIQPLLDQVRFNPCIITETLEGETSPEKWKKLESHDITANIRKLSLDINENTYYKDNLFINPQNTPKNLLTLDEKLNLHQIDKLNLPAVEDTSLNESENSGFVPNRPHQTASSCSTPLFNTIRFFSPNCSPLPGSSDVNLPDSKQPPIQRDTCVELNMDALTPNKDIYEEMKSQQPSNHLDDYLFREIIDELKDSDEVIKSFQRDSCSSQQVEYSPGQIKDLYMKLMTDTYLKSSDKNNFSNDKEAEWRFSDSSNSQTQQNNNKQSSVSESLRLQILQSHFSMLYERSKREEQAARVRKYARLLRESQKSEEQVTGMRFQIKALQDQVESYVKTIKILKTQYKESCDLSDDKENQMKTQITEYDKNLEASEKSKDLLLQENKKLRKENVDLKKNVSELNHRLFELEKQACGERVNRKDVAEYEKKLKQIRVQMLNVKIQNRELLNEKEVYISNSVAKLQEAKALIASYEKKCSVETKFDLFRSVFTFFHSFVS